MTTATDERLAQALTFAYSPDGLGDLNSVQIKRSGGRRSREFEYWKKKVVPHRDGIEDESGYIAIGENVQTDPGAFSRLIQDKGWTPLGAKFGRCTYGGEMSYGPTRYALWIANGGLTATDAFGEYLMPARQIISYRWHEKPEVCALRPDVAGQDTFRCPEPGCGSRKFNSERLVDEHTQVMHKDVLASKAMGRELNRVLSGGSDDTDKQAQLIAGVLRALGMVPNASPPQERALPVMPFGPQSIQGNEPVRLYEPEEPVGVLKFRVQKQDNQLSYPDGPPRAEWKHPELQRYAKDIGLTETRWKNDGVKTNAMKHDELLAEIQQFESKTEE